MFDISGKKVATESYVIQKNMPHLVSMKQVAKGVYTLELTWGNEKRSVKVLVE